LKLSTGQRGNFARNAADAEAIATVGRHRDLEQPIFTIRVRLAQ
jgi:hypothetical protein